MTVIPNAIETVYGKSSAEASPLFGLEIVENEALLNLVAPGSDLCLVSESAIAIGFLADRPGRRFLLANQAGVAAIKNVAGARL